MAQLGKAALDRGCGVGAGVVTLKVDYRTHNHAPGLLGVVYAFKAESGGILVCCEHGIITHDGSKSQYWVPVDKYTWWQTRTHMYQYRRNFKQFVTWFSQVLLI